MIIGKSRITGKGQLQLPAKIRKKIGAEIGDELLFKENDKGEIIIKIVKKENISSLAGALPVKKKFPGIEEEERKSREKVAEKAGKYDEEKK
ncbi:MAG: AbrB/MazE/SpoVT family DNA-binding domain-containing protein [Candidatus Syntrophonatronum acetioxidans]|uniref:AbrB/MazE/SpoVT family DNA-binding domain-containing protein n=1 Tax=Candidatus Syntrophonatronum acetioxidans TaxID=1795816 RepID=A0A424YCL7_9FIRM|nr:MAG: AbrB/MazE/SpoVT family DNA-binding domain-containing protein [Candidatus Syntrophonatronum acetioxidans]